MVSPFQPGAFQDDAFQIELPLPEQEQEALGRAQTHRRRARRAPIILAGPELAEVVSVAARGTSINRARAAAVVGAALLASGVSTAKSATSAAGSVSMDWLRMARLEDEELLVLL